MDAERLAKTGTAPLSRALKANRPMISHRQSALTEPGPTSGLSSFDKQGRSPTLRRLSDASRLSILELLAARRTCDCIASPREGIVWRTGDIASSSFTSPYWSIGGRGKSPGQYDNGRTWELYGVDSKVFIMAAPSSSFLYLFSCYFLIVRFQFLSSSLHST